MLAIAKGDNGIERRWQKESFVADILWILEAE